MSKTEMSSGIDSNKKRGRPGTKPDMTNPNVAAVQELLKPVDGKVVATIWNHAFVVTSDLKPKPDTRGTAEKVSR